jgi:MOSC domain-containing protein YiiM
MSSAIVSVNVGMPRLVSWRGRQVTTGIFKSPVEHAVRVRELNVDGDGQADLSVHGGPDKAIYAYPAEHYAWWQVQLGIPQLRWGQFGENLTTTGLFETDVHIGDRYRMGTVEAVVTQPRLPCYKLGVRFRRADMPKRFLASRRFGFYFRVLREGEMAAGCVVEKVAAEPHQVSVAEVTELYLADSPPLAALERALLIRALPEDWKVEFRARLGQNVTRPGVPWG